MKVKKISITILFIIIIAIIPQVVIGCSKKTDYYGTYNSIFVDSQNDAEDISFTLKINKDTTFELNKSTIKTQYKGTWKSYTVSGKQQLLCYIEDGYQWSSRYPNAWNPYFTICFLDDGTLMATPGSTFGSSSSSTAFGVGEITYITLILFEKS